MTLTVIEPIEEPVIDEENLFILGEDPIYIEVNGRHEFNITTHIT